MYRVPVWLREYIEEADFGLQFDNSATIGEEYAVFETSEAEHASGFDEFLKALSLPYDRRSVSKVTNEDLYYFSRPVEGFESTIETQSRTSIPIDSLETWASEGMDIRQALEAHKRQYMPSMTIAQADEGIMAALAHAIRGGYQVFAAWALDSGHVDMDILAEKMGGMQKLLWTARDGLGPEAMAVIEAYFKDQKQTLSDDPFTQHRLRSS
jgi:hypothetical protein